MVIANGQSRNFVIDFLLIFLLTFSPFAFGAVHLPAVILFSLISLIIFILYFYDKSNLIKQLLKLPLVKWCVFFITVIIFQLVNSPQSLLKIISPSTYRLYASYSLKYVSTGSWHSISIYPWFTIYELIKFVAYGLILLIILGMANRGEDVLSDTGKLYSQGEGIYHQPKGFTREATGVPQREISPLFIYLQLGCLTGVLAILLHSLVDFNLHIPANAFYFIVILALAIGIDDFKDSLNFRFILKIVDSIIIIGFCIALFGIVYKFSGPPGKIYWVIAKEGGIFGPYINCDHFAGYIEMCASLAIASFFGHIRVSAFFISKGIKNKILWFSSLEASKTILYLFFSVIITASLFLSASRGGILSFSMAIILFFFFIASKIKKGRRIRVVSFFIMIILLITIVVIWIGPEAMLNKFIRLNTNVRAIIHEPSILSEIRLIMWKDVIKPVKDFPVFGSGIGTFSCIFPKYRTFEADMEFLRYAHNDYLQLIVEMGLCGLIFIIAFLVFFIKIYHNTVKKLS